MLVLLSSHHVQITSTVWKGAYARAGHSMLMLEVEDSLQQKSSHQCGAPTGSSMLILLSAERRPAT